MNDGLREWRREKLQEHHIINFWYFAFIDNLDLILEHGIIPKNEVDRRGLQYRSFAEETVQVRRHHRFIHLTNHQRYTTHDVVPVYLCPRTPTLFARRDVQDELFFARIQSFILLDDGVEFAFTDGNIASDQSRYFVDLNRLTELPWNVIRAPYWNDFPDGRRQRNAEFLIFPRIPITRFWELGVSNQATRARAQEIIANRNLEINVSIQEDWFF